MLLFYAMKRLMKRKGYIDNLLSYKDKCLVIVVSK